MQIPALLPLFAILIAVARAEVTPDAYLKASNPGSDDRFGRSVAMDGDTLVIGAPGEASGGSGEEDESLPEAGAVYVFVRQGDDWVQEARLKPEEPSEGDQFGCAVAIDGDKIVVGARGNDSDFSSSPVLGGARDSGAAYVFVRNGSSWTEEAYLKAFIPNGGIEDMAVGDAFGTSVDIDGNTIAIAAPNEDDLAGESGAVYVYTWTGTEWFGQQRIKAPTPAPGDHFGPLALHDETLVVGAPDRTSDSGEVNVFVRTDSVWSLLTTLKAPNAGAGDAFGKVVAIYGDTIAVGAPLEDGSATGIGGTSNNSARDSGAVYLFFRSGSTWGPGVYVKASNSGAGDQFGSSLALDRETLVVGAAVEDSAATGIDGNQTDNSAADSGSAYVFTYSEGSWLQSAYVKGSNTGAGDGFGGPGGVATSGLIVAVGAMLEDSSSIGVGGNGALDDLSDAGAAYTFRSDASPFAPVFHSAADKGWSALDPLPATRLWGGVTLDFVPLPGTSLTVIEKTHPGFIKGSLTGLAHGQKITLVHAERRYNFVANYHGGDGNDLVLQWAGVMPRTWGRQRFNPEDFSQPFQKVVIGGGHMLGLKGDGTVAAWGDNRYGQVNVPEGLSGVRDISAGLTHSMAVLVDGSVVRWGIAALWSDSSCLPPEGLAGIGELDSGLEHGLARKLDGTVVTWGRSSGTIAEDLSDVISIGAGFYHSVALLADGTVVGSSGSAAPAGLTDVTAIAAGDYHTLALKSDGTVVAWGVNSDSRSTPPAGLGGVVAIAAGDKHSIALKGDGTVVAWGSNNRGQLGIPEDAVDVAAISAAGPHTMAMKRDGTIVVWGRGYDFDYDPYQFTLMSPWRFPDLVAIAAGGDHNLALRSDGNVVHWGDSDYRLSNVPTRATDVVAVAAGFHHSVVLKADGGVVVWGEDDWGQSFVTAGLKAATISACGNSSVAIREDRTAAGWGSGTSNFGTVSGFGVLATSPQGSFGIKHDGSAWNPGTGVSAENLTNVTALAAGNGHRMALRGNGSVVAWGNNSKGQVDVPESLSGAIAIAAGSSHSLALMADRSLAAWGSNESGQTSIQSNAGGVAAIAAGSGHSTALAAVKPFLGPAYISGLSNGGATVHGETNPNGQPTTLAVEYGVDLSYGSTTAIPLPAADDGIEVVPGSVALSGLQPGTTYHWRLVAESPSGTTVGPALRFTTPLTDTMPPVISRLAIRSASVPPSGPTEYAKAGTLISLSITTNEAIQPPVVEICGRPVIATGSGAEWLAELTVEAGFTQGPASISVTATDLADNSAEPVITATEGAVIVDTVPPEIAVSELTVEVLATGGAVVNFDDLVVVTDSAGAGVSTSCEPASGSLFPLGVSQVSVVATDPAGNDNTASFRVTVLDAREYWRHRYFRVTSNSGDAADDADPDGDGLCNLLEAAFNLDPLQAGVSVLEPDSSSRSGLPRITLQGTEGMRRLRIEYLRRRSDTEPLLVWEAQFSSLSGEANGWATATGDESVIPIDDVWERVIVEDEGGLPKRFGRVRIQVP